MLAQRAQRELYSKRTSKELAEASLAGFIRQAWRVLEPETELDWNWHIDAIAAHLEAVSDGRIKRLLINIPPRTGKSTIASVMWPCWDWIRHPARRWLFTSYSDGLALTDSVKSRRLLLSNWYQSHWGHLFKLVGDQNAKEYWENNHTGYRISTSIHGKATGRGCDFLVGDDLHNVKDRESEVMRERVLGAWSEVMSTRLNNPKTGAKVIIGQRVHERDVSGLVLEQGGYEHLCIPMEYEVEI